MESSGLSQSELGREVGQLQAQAGHFTNKKTVSDTHSTGGWTSAGTSLNAVAKRKKKNTNIVLTRSLQQTLSLLLTELSPS
jgi:hypothetical protein